MEYARAVRFGLKRRIRNARPLLLDENLSWQHPQNADKRRSTFRTAFSKPANRRWSLVSKLQMRLLMPNSATDQNRSQQPCRAAKRRSRVPRLGLLATQKATFLRFLYGAIATFFPIFTPGKICFSH
jgi:hypothetical protein